MSRNINTIATTDLVILIQETGGRLVRRKIHNIVGNSPEFDRPIVINYNDKGDTLHLSHDAKPGFYDGIPTRHIESYAIFES